MAEEKIGEDKKEDKKKFELEIKGTQADPKGLSFEIYSISNDLYNSFADDSQEYMSKALSVLTISINIPEKEILDKIEIFFKESRFSFPKELIEKNVIHFRISGNKMFIDFVSMTFLQTLLDLGLNFSEFHNFYASFKSEFKPNELFSSPDKELNLCFLKALQLVLSVKGQLTNTNFIITALIKALKEVKCKNYKYIFQDKLNKLVKKLILLKSFLSFCFNFEFNAKELYSVFLEEKKFKEFIEIVLDIKKISEENIIPELNNYGLKDIFKKISEFSISLTFPKYRNGIAIEFPGFHKKNKYKLLELRKRNYEKRKGEIKNIATKVTSEFNSL